MPNKKKKKAQKPVEHTDKYASTPKGPKKKGK